MHAAGALAEHNLIFYPSPISEEPTSPTKQHAAAPLTPASDHLPPRLDLALPPHPPSPSSIPPQTPVTVKRSRGRPRKHPVRLPGAETRVQKGRSKTGCLTCRKRKKKCDESKPTCLNCEKNGIVCGGYKPLEPLRSAPRPTSSRGAPAGTSIEFVLPVRNVVPPTRQLESLDALDDRLFQHYQTELGPLLWPNLGEPNDLPSTMARMALSPSAHASALRHSLLSLSAAHLLVSSSASPVQLNSFQRAFEQHYHEAVRMMNASKIFESHVCGQQSESDDFALAHVMLLCLQAAVFGECKGEHRAHLTAGHHILQCMQKPSMNHYWALCADFITYHQIIGEVMSHSCHQISADDDGYHGPPQIMDPSHEKLALAVPRDLLSLVKDISILRGNIRKRRLCGHKPYCDYQNLVDGELIRAALGEWVAPHRHHSALQTLDSLYHRCASVYLSHTVQNNLTDSLSWEIEAGLADIFTLLADQMSQHVLFPLFLLGCTTTNVAQRPRVEEAFDKLQQARGFRNVVLARNMVHEIWRLMDGRDSCAWDWEGVITKNNIDFIMV